MIKFLVPTIEAPIFHVICAQSRGNFHKITQSYFAYTFHRMVNLKCFPLPSSEPLLSINLNRRDEENRYFYQIHTRNCFEYFFVLYFHSYSHNALFSHTSNIEEQKIFLFVSI